MPKQRKQDGRQPQPPPPGLRLLLAGRGGLNMTHAEDPREFGRRYTGSAAEAARSAVKAWGGADGVRAWAEDLGVDTFVGTSGRVFPRELRATPLLRSWLRRLDDAGVSMHTRRRLVGFKAAGNGVSLSFHDERTGDGHEEECDAAVLALGGASWPGLGSDGAWQAWRELDVAPLRPANAGLRVSWSDVFRERFAGAHVKDVRLHHAHSNASSAGDLIVTASGVEGGPVYALGELACPTELAVDFRPALSLHALADKLRAGGRKRSASERLRRAGVSPVALPLLREMLGAEAATAISQDAHKLAAAVKAAPLHVASAMPLGRAISTAGGVIARAAPSAGQVDAGTLALSGMPGVFLAGEQLDWSAPTGGYLLTASFATGRLAAAGAVAFARARRP